MVCELILLVSGASVDVPNGEDTAGFRKARLLLNAADALLEDGGDLGGRGLVGVGAGLYRGDVEGGCCGISCLGKNTRLAETPKLLAALELVQPSKKL